jgi:Fe-Mn family superoxide dismutase
MQTFTQKTFNIGELKGISAKNVEEHLKLYAGYVKNANGIMEKMAELDSEKDAYIVGEMFRRFSFEYNGIRNHELYFSSLSDGARPLGEESELKNELVNLFGSMENFIKEFTNLALTRGIGWAMLWYDKKEKRFLATWVDEQHLGQLQGCSPVIALDMWEHAYVYDYPTSEKKKYIEAFFENLNWSVIENNYREAIN